MKKVIAIFLTIIFIFSLSACGIQKEYVENAIYAAESYVTSKFFDDYGENADEIESEIIYTGEDNNGSPIHLISAKCYKNDIIVGSYCVKTKLGSFRNATRMLPSGYDFDANLKDLKAMFGIIEENTSNTEKSNKTYHTDSLTTEEKNIIEELTVVWEQLSPEPEVVVGTVEYWKDSAGDDFILYYSSDEKLYYSTIKIKSSTVTNHGMVLTENVLNQIDNAPVVYVDGKVVAEEFNLQYISFTEFKTNMNYSFEDVRNNTAEKIEKDLMYYIFIDEFDGIYVNMDTYTASSFEFLSLNEGEYLCGAYPGGIDRTGNIHKVSKNDNEYMLKLYYPAEEYMGDFYEEEYVDWKIEINDGLLKTLSDSPSARKNTSWRYMGKSLDGAIVAMEPYFEIKKDENDGDAFDLFVDGTWWDLWSRRCYLEMEVIDNETVQIEVNWSSGATCNTVWNFIGKWDANTGKLNYENGVMVELEYLEGKQEASIIREYTDGTGYFYFNDGYLYWVDKKETVGENCYFEPPME